MTVVEWKDTGLLSCPTIVPRTVFLLQQQLLPGSAFVHSCLTLPRDTCYQAQIK